MAWAAQWPRVNHRHTERLVICSQRELVGARRGRGLPPPFGLLHRLGDWWREGSSCASSIVALTLRQPHFYRASERASEPATEQASEQSKRARERDRVAQGRRPESGTLSRLAAAAGLAPDVKFSCGKAQLHFTVLILIPSVPRIRPDYQLAR